MTGAARRLRSLSAALASAPASSDARAVAGDGGQSPRLAFSHRSPLLLTEHVYGDAALRWVVRQLRDRLRSEDTIGRLGGDEFGLIAEVAAGRIDALLGQINDVPQGSQPQFTVSVGAVLAEDGDDVESGLHRADQKMYAVKRKRRAAQM